MPPTKVTLDKLAVAERQIDTAIWLWFNGGDVVSIVTLSSTALEVMEDLFQERKKGMRPFPFEAKDAPPEMAPKAARNFVKIVETFAKYSGHKYNKSFDYYFDDVEAYLYCAVVAYFNFSREHRPLSLHGLFWKRYGITHPTVFKHGAIFLAREQIAEVERLKSLTRREYFHQRGQQFAECPPSPDIWPDDRHTNSLRAEN